MLDGLQQKNNRENPQKTCHQHADNYETIQGSHRQQHIVFSLNGFDGEAMLQQRNGQQRQANADEDYAGDVGCGLSSQRTTIGKPLTQTAVYLIDRNTNADQAQTVADPGIDGTFGGGSVSFLSQLVCRAEQLLGLRLTHRIQLI